MEYTSQEIFEAIQYVCGATSPYSDDAVRSVDIAVAALEDAYRNAIANEQEALKRAKLAKYMYDEDIFTCGVDRDFEYESQLDAEIARLDALIEAHNARIQEV